MRSFTQLFVVGLITISQGAYAMLPTQQFLDTGKIIVIADSERSGSPASNVNGPGLQLGTLHNKDFYTGGHWSTLGNPITYPPTTAYGYTNPNPGTVAGPSWIKFTFDNIYSIGEIWIWNYNAYLWGGPATGRGMRNVIIQYSTDGTNWTSYNSGNPVEIPQASAIDGETRNLVINLGGANVKYFVITACAANGNWGSDTKEGDYDFYGLSEVRFGLSGTTYQIDYDIERSVADANIIVTASSQFAGSKFSPRNTINRLGMNYSNLHSNDYYTGNWMTAAGGNGYANPNPGTVSGPAWIKYAFDKVYDIGKMTVWNYNGFLSGQPITERGMRNVTVQYSEDGSTWNTLSESTTLYNDSFDVYAVGSAVSGPWYNWYTGGSTISNAAAKTGTQCVDLTYGGSYGGMIGRDIAKNLLVDGKGIATLSFKDNGAGSPKFYMNLSDMDSWGQNGKMYAKLYVSYWEGIFSVDSSWQMTKLVDAGFGQNWNTLSVSFDIVAGTYDVVYNGVVVGSSIPTYDAPNPASTATLFRVLLDDDNAQNPAIHTYIDDWSLVTGVNTFVELRKATGANGISPTDTIIINHPAKYVVITAADANGNWGHDSLYPGDNYYGLSEVRFGIKGQRNIISEEADCPGAFIALDWDNYLGFDIARWQQEFDHFDIMGLKTLVVCTAVSSYYTNVPLRAYYHSDIYPFVDIAGNPYHDGTPIDTIMALADLRGYDVYLGIFNDYVRFNGNGNFGSTENDQYIYDNDVTVANELMAKYGTHPCIKGFYLVQEAAFGVDLGTRKPWRDAADYLHTTYPGKKVACAPYVVLPVSNPPTPSQVATWAHQFALDSHVDQMYYQDLSDWDHTTIDTMETYINAIAPAVSTTSCEFRTTLTNFTLNEDKTLFIPAPISRVAQQVEIESQYKPVIYAILYQDPNIMGYWYPAIDPAKVQLWNDYLNAFIVPQAYVAHTGDFYPDGIVTFKDFAMFAENWFKTGSSAAKFDLASDGTVNFKDLAIFAENWLK